MTASTRMLRTKLAIPRTTACGIMERLAHAGRLYFIFVLGLRVLLYRILSYRYVMAL